MNLLIYILDASLPMISIIITLIGVICSVVKIKKKSKGVQTLMCTLIFGCVAYLFLASHGTWIVYNDWWICGKHIEDIRSRYGEYDYEVHFFDGGGRVGYYLYHSNGLMLDPNYLEHYYIMEYDEQGKVYSISLGAQQGG